MTEEVVREGSEILGGRSAVCRVQKLDMAFWMRLISSLLQLGMRTCHTRIVKADPSAPYGTSDPLFRFLANWLILMLANAAAPLSGSREVPLREAGDMMFIIFR